MPCPERPPEAKPGEAWCRVWVPPVKGLCVETYLVRPACKKKVRVPPTYDTRVNLVCVAPPKCTEVYKPGVWKTRKRQVCVCPEREVIEPIDCKSSDLAEGEVQCQCYTKRVIPPTYREVCEAVCVEPSRTCVQYEPAKYRCVEETFVVKEAHCDEVLVPAEYATRTREVCLRPGRWEWRRNTDCEVPEEKLPALEVTMIDNDPSGERAGIFYEGQNVRYDLTVTSDVGSQAVPALKVVFTLPPELQFVSAGGDVQVQGKGQGAKSVVFARRGPEGQRPPRGEGHRRPPDQDGPDHGLGADEGRSRAGARDRELDPRERRGAADRRQVGLPTT